MQGMQGFGSNDDDDDEEGGLRLQGEGMRRGAVRESVRASFVFCAVSTSWI
jgi:hypothetical protein